MSPAGLERRQAAGDLGGVFSKSGLIDLLVIVATLAPFLGSEAIALRLLRLMRLLQLAKLGRMSAAMRHLVSAVASRRDELALTILLALCLMTAGATAFFGWRGRRSPTSSAAYRGRCGGR